MTAMRSFAAGARPLRVREAPNWPGAVRVLPTFAREVTHRAPIS